MLTINARLDSDADALAFVNLYSSHFGPVSPVDVVVHGLGDPEGWGLLSVATPRGVAVVLRRGDELRVRVYAADGACAGSEVYSLAAGAGDRDRYYRLRTGPGGSYRLRRVRSEALDDTEVTAVVGGLAGPARVAELDQFYEKNGFLRVECSHDLPAEVLATMLLIGWRAVSREVDKVMSPGPDRATAA